MRRCGMVAMDKGGVEGQEVMEAGWSWCRRREGRTGGRGECGAGAGAGGAPLPGRGVGLAEFEENTFYKPQHRTPRILNISLLALFGGRRGKLARQFQVNFLCAHMQDRVIPTANKQEIWRRWGISPASRPRPQDGWQLAGVHRNPAGGISFKLGGIAHSEPADIPGGSSTSRGRNFVQTNISPEGPLLAMGRRLAACICNRGLASAQVGLCAQQRRGARPS